MKHWFGLTSAPLHTPSRLHSFWEQSSLCVQLWPSLSLHFFPAPVSVQPKASPQLQFWAQAPSWLTGAVQAPVQHQPVTPSAVQLKLVSFPAQPPHT
jgi:hypothetical protein